MKKTYLIIILLLCIKTLQAQNWSTPTTIIQNMPKQPGNSSLCTDKDNNLYYVWTSTENPHTIFFTTMQNEEWSVPQQIHTYQGNLSNVHTPNITVDSDFILHLAWTESTPIIGSIFNHSLYYSSLKNEIWTTPQKIWFSNNKDLRVHSQIIYSSNDLTYLYWLTAGSENTVPKNAFWIQSLNGSNWSEPVKPFPMWSMGYGSTIHYSHIYITKNSLYLVLGGVPPDTSWNNNPPTSEIYYSYKSKQDSVWAPLVEVYQNTSTNSSNCKIAVDSKGIKHIIWGDDTEGDIWPGAIFYSYSQDGKNWSDPFLISKMGTMMIAYTLTVDSNDILHLVWTHWDFGETFKSKAYYCYRRMNSWSQPQEIPKHLENNLYGPIDAVALDSRDILHIVWKEKYGTTEKKYRILHSKTDVTNIDVKSMEKKEDISALQIQNFPNPFNQSTTFFLNISTPTVVSLKIYNTLGQLVKTLASEQQFSDKKLFEWDGTNHSGLQMPSGIYFYRLIAKSGFNKKGGVITGKVIILR